MNDDTKTLYTLAKLESLNIPYVTCTEEDTEQVVKEIDDWNLKDNDFVNALIEVNTR